MQKSTYNIAADSTFAEAGDAAISKQVEELFRNLPGTRAGDDPEALHDMRVASRRLRAALSVFEDLFSPKDFRPIEREVSQVTDALGAVRDADVQIEFMTECRDSAPESERVGLDLFLDHLKKHRDSERVHLIKALDALERSKLKADIEKLLRDACGGQETQSANG